MLFLIYDSTFEGFLSVVDKCIKENLTPAMITTDKGFQPHLFAEVKHVKKNFTKSTSLTNTLKNISNELFRTVFYAFLAKENLELQILAYFRLALLHKNKLNSFRSNNDVRQVLEAKQRVGFEVQRIYGLLRFRKLKNDLYYAVIEPDNDILPLLSAHFSRRFADQNWIIHDLKRSSALIHKKGDIEIIKLTEPNRELIDIHSKKGNKYLAEEELAFQEHWQTFFEHIAIKERTNGRCQKQFMPVRYWKYLIEKPAL